MFKRIKEYLRYRAIARRFNNLLDTFVSCVLEEGNVAAQGNVIMVRDLILSEFKIRESYKSYILSIEDYLKSEICTEEIPPEAEIRQGLLIAIAVLLLMCIDTKIKSEDALLAIVRR